MKQALLMTLLLAALMPAAFSGSYMTGCCPDEVLGTDATEIQLNTYLSTHGDLCGDGWPDGSIPYPCVVEEGTTRGGGGGCCLPLGARDTDGTRRAYAEANRDVCGDWPEGRMVTACPIERTGGDPLTVEATAVELAPDWIPLSIMAALAGLGVLVIFYLFTYLVDAEQMRPMVTSEMWQVFVTAAMIALFIGFQAFSSDVISPAFAEDFMNESDTENATHVQYAMEITRAMADFSWETLDEFTNNVVMPMGNLASLSGNCWMFGVAFSFNGCASISVPFSAASFAARTMSTAILTLNSQLVLLRMANSFLFPVLLPFGLFLRTFHVTRGTGGFLIAFAFAFYFIYPLSVLITQGFYDAVPIPGIREPNYPSIGYVSSDATWDIGSVLFSWDVPGDCDPFEGNYGYTQDQIDYLMDDSLMDPLLFIFMIGGIFNPAINLVITLSVLRTLTRVFGTEVDVSVLSRIA